MIFPVQFYRKSFTWSFCFLKVYKSFLKISFYKVFVLSIDQFSIYLYDVDCCIKMNESLTGRQTGINVIKHTHRNVKCNNNFIRVVLSARCVYVHSCFCRFKTLLFFGLLYYLSFRSSRYEKLNN